MTTPYIDPNLIFAENAPVQDKPAAFQNYDKGWDASRNNDGRPLIPQMNYLTQQADLKNLYIHNNGAALPYKEGIAYEENAVVVKDGVLQQWKGGEWVVVSEQEVRGYLLDAGVAEAELDGEYNYLMQRLAQIAVDKGWDASFVVDASGKNQQEINNYTVRKLDENYSITDFIIIGENYTNVNFDWSPVYERAIQYILSKGGGRLNTPHKGTPYALNGILRTDGQIVGIEIPFTGGSDFGATATKVDFVCESQAVKFIPLQDDMIVFRHSSSYCEVGKFQIHHNGKLRCTGFALTPQNWTNPASASQQSHNHIHDIYTYGMLEGFIYQSGGSGGCYYNTAVNCYAVGTTAQGGRGLVLKAGIKSTGQATRASPPNRNRFYNFKAFSTNVAIDIQSGDTNYFFGLSSENNSRAGVFAEIPTALRVENIDSEGHGVQGNVIYGLSIEGATKDAEILASRTRIYGHTMSASKTTLSSDFVSSENGTIIGCFDATVFPEISGGVINNIGGVIPSGLPPYTVGKTDTQITGIHDVDGRFKSYALSLDKFTGVAAVSNSVSYTSKYNNRVDFECRFNFRPLAANSVIQVALPFEANFNLYANLTTHEQSFAFPVYIQYGAASNRQIAFARVVSLNGTTATHFEVQAPAAGWNIAADGQYNVIHAQLNYRAK